MTADILAALAAPFDPSVISWRIGSVSKEKLKGMALAYLDSRDVQDRLNAVMGLDWQVRHPWSNGTKLACEIGLKIDGEWIWRGDGAGDSDVEAEKGAFSDSFKRAAVRWGIGRYLYDVHSPWVTVEPAGKSWRIPDTELRRLANVLPRPGAQTQATARPAAPAPAPITPQQDNGDDPFAPASPPLSEAAAEFVASLRKRIGEARLPSRIDDLIKANNAGLGRLKEESAQAYGDLMRFASVTKDEMLVRAA